jgi:hypothetical protein
VLLDDLFYRLGSAAGAVDAQFSGKGGAGSRRAREVAVYEAENGEVHDMDPETDDAIVDSIAMTAAAAVLARVLRPKPVSWPRVIVAGVAASAFADFVGRVTEAEPAPDREPHAEDSEELLARFGAGIGIAAGYAALLYPRLPGPGLLRGLLFGALEVAAAPRGGLVRLATDTPGLKFPLQTLASPIDEDAGPLSHLAFGLGLGLFYRASDE